MENPENQVLAVLRRFPEVTRVWLFGSRARGDNRPRSDVDIAVEAPTASRSAWSRIRLDALDAKTLHHVDVVRFEEASQALRDNILKDGRILYEQT
jgi:predicted nucleotidyltransferase